MSTSRLLILLRQRGVNDVTGAGRTVSYLLQSTFATARAAPLPASLPIEVGGPLTVLDVNNILSVSSGRLVASGTPVSNNGMLSPIFTRVCGRAFGIDMPVRTTANGGIPRLGWSSATLGDNTVNYGVDYIGKDSIRIKDGATVIDTVVFAAVPHEFVAVMRDTGALLFLD